jgi:hypothetical protein
MESNMRVTTRNPSHTEPNRFAFDQPKFCTYEGELISTPKWCAEGSIALATGNPLWPMRVLDGSLIVSIDDVEIVKPQPNVRTVTVDGSKGEKYLVTITPTEKTCTCVGFGFRRHCKHIAMVSN